MTGDAEVARDLAQETFVRVYQHRRRYDPSYAFATWLFTIATNLSRNHHRWRHRHPEVLMEPTSMAGADLPSHAQDPRQMLASAECSAAVPSAIAMLPEVQRVVLMLSVYGQLSHAEIAAIADSSVKAAELRIYRARCKLRRLLADWLPASQPAEGRRKSEPPARHPDVSPTEPLPT